MKTLCLVVTLLLLTVCCCNAMPRAVQKLASPDRCCYKFGTRTVPLGNVKGIHKTPKHCGRKAFVVETQGGAFCYSQRFQWALEVYKQLTGAANTYQQQ